MKHMVSWAALFAVVLPASGRALGEVSTVVRKAAPATVWIEWEVQGDEARNANWAQRRVHGLVALPPYPPHHSYTSGVVVSSDGLIATTLPGEAKNIVVYLENGDRHEAKVLVVDGRSATRACLLKVDANKLTALPLASAEPQIGETAIAVTAVGPRGRVAARGIVSGTGQRPGERLDFLQSDVRVGAGSTGAPLCNEQGELMGIVAAVDVANQATLALPSVRIHSLLQHRKSKTPVTIQGGFLGLFLEDDKERRGVLVASVRAASPAAEAGILAGDLVMRIDGRVTDSPHDVQGALAMRSAGERVKLELVREGKAETVLATLAPAPKSAAAESPKLKIDRVQPGLMLFTLPDGRQMSIPATLDLKNAPRAIYLPQSPPSSKAVKPGDPLAVNPRDPLAVKPGDPLAVNPRVGPKLPQPTPRPPQPTQSRTPLPPYEMPMATLPGLRVYRSPSDHKLQQLIDEVKSLRKQVEDLSNKIGGGDDEQASDSRFK